VVRGLGHLDFSILSLNGDSKVPIFLFSLFLSPRRRSVESKKLGYRSSTHRSKKAAAHDKKRRQRKTQI